MTHGAAVTKQESLHDGQKGDELQVVALMKLRRIAGDLIKLARRLWNQCRARTSPA